MQDLFFKGNVATYLWERRCDPVLVVDCLQ